MTLHPCSASGLSNFAGSKDRATRCECVRKCTLPIIEESGLTAFIAVCNVNNLVSNLIGHAFLQAILVVGSNNFLNIMYVS